MTRDDPFLAGRWRAGAAPADPLRDDGRQVRAEGLVEPADLARGLGQERQLLLGRAFAAQLGEDEVRRATARLGRRDRRDGRRVPALDTGQCRIEIQAAERPRQGSAALVRVLCRKRDGREGGQQQEVPLPPAEMPVPADDHRDECLGEQHECGRHRQQDGIVAVPELAGQLHGRERVEADGDERQDVEDAGPFAGWGRAVEGRHLGDRADGPQRP